MSKIKALLDVGEINFKSIRVQDGTVALEYYVDHEHMENFAFDIMRRIRSSYEEELLRSTNPGLQELYAQYQTMLKLIKE